MFGKLKLVLIFLSTAIVVYGLVGGILENVSAENDIYGQLEMFTTVLSRLKAEYVEEPDMDRAINGALLGMIEAVDPFSSFVQGDIFASLQQREGAVASPGLILSKRHGYAYVVSVVPGSPAAEAGLRTGDIVESLEDRVTTEMSLWEIVNRLKGRQGTDVTIRVVRSRRSHPTEVQLTRAVTSPGGVQATVIEDSIGLLSIPHFHAGVSQEVRSRLQLLLAAGVEGILVDVRGSSGASIEEAAQVADLFLARGQVILRIADRSGTSGEFLSEQEPLIGAEVVGVLVDGGTSEAAEVFTAALIDNQRVFSVGLRTNGHGTIQEKFELADGSVMFLATKLMVRPNGEPIQGKTLRSSGVRPETRSPSQDFVTNFYLENAREEFGEENAEEFYQDLEDAVVREQLERGLEEVRRRILKKAA